MSEVTYRLLQAHNWRVSPHATRFAGQAMNPNQTLCFNQVHRPLDSLFDGDLHAKRVLSLADATLGVIKTSNSKLRVRVIFRGFGSLISGGSRAGRDAPLFKVAVWPRRRWTEAGGPSPGRPHRW